ncbi:hypothetical protein AB9F46_35840, partial [Rhizobium leguminosarum]
YAFGYTAFGEIDIWYGDAMIRLNLLMNKVRVDPLGYNEEHQREWTDEVMLGLRFSGRFAPDHRERHSPAPASARKDCRAS